MNLKLFTREEALFYVDEIMDELGIDTYRESEAIKYLIERSTRKGFCPPITENFLWHICRKVRNNFYEKCYLKSGDK